MDKIKKISKQTSSSYIVIALGLLCILLTVLVRETFATLLDNDVEVKENSQLTYYLNISYDGIDRNGVKSGDTIVSEIKSGYLYVEDKIPDGLTFDGFVTTSDGSIGAVKRSDGSICTGKVIDDTNEESVDAGVWNDEHTEYTYHGLHYNDETRTVTFTIKNLMAGCELTVGIKTITPTVDDPDTEEKELRRDFYNFATARENALTVNSNTVHVFMGSEFATLYNVSYEYSGDIPANAPSLPGVSSYAPGIKVGVSSDVKLEGYTFSGWTTDNVTVVNNSFIMPDTDVVFKGSFTKNNTNKVTYSLFGITPPGYVLPTEKSYFAGTTIKVDSLKIGDVFNGYRFLGWTSSNVEISSDNDFEMPEEDVVLTGEFEEVTYKVSYQFYDTVLPPNSEDYLPQAKEYKPGSTVILENVLDEPTGYKFLGWYKESSFEMPEEDVVIYGEWKVQAGTFEPTITKEIVSEKEFYRVGDVVKFKVTVTNTASFAITNVIVKENNTNSKFIAGDNYTVLSEHVASIDSIASGEKVELYATYTVLATDENIVENTAEIKGALADNDYVLLEQEYKDSSSFNIQSKLKICKEVSGASVPNVFQFHIVGTTNNYETWVTLEKDQCETIFIDPSTYKISEIVPQEYEIKSVEGAITSDNSTLLVEQGKDYEVTYTNEFKKKGFLHSFGRITNKIIQGGE